MTIHLYNRPIPSKSINTFDIGKTIEMIRKLKEIQKYDWNGDCVELDFDPEVIRKYIDNVLKIRRIKLTTWRVWRLYDKRTKQ